MGQRFCRQCGTEHVPSKLKEKLFFNPDTGAPEPQMVCPNPKCIWGCEENGGHDYGPGWWFQRRTCRKCGWVNPAFA